MINSIFHKAKLNNGVEMPLLGLGVYLINEGKELQNAINWAFKAGYRHIDTARFYENERGVGLAVKNSSIPRNEIFIVTKLWNDSHQYDKALKAFDDSLNLLGLEYIDLYLIHWPGTNKRKEAWKALQKIYSEGRARSIGVSNYTIAHLEELLNESGLTPAVNQVEFSPFLYQKDLLEFCRKNEILLTAYSPLARGDKMENKTLNAVATKYKKTPAQIMIHWALELGIAAIPKSSSQKRIIENSQVFDFSLDQDDMNLLSSLNEDYRVTWDPSFIP